MAAKTYGSVNAQANLITDFYGGSNSGAQRITKLYGSASTTPSAPPEAKLIYQGFGHADYSVVGFGKVTYYIDSSHTQTADVNMFSPTDIDGLCASFPTPTAWTAIVNGVSIPQANIKEVTLFSSVTSLPDNFLYYCTSLEKLDISKTKITTIGNYFAALCYELSSELTLPSTLTSIGGAFLSGCTSFNHALAIPSEVTSIGYNFLSRCSNLISPVNIGSLSETVILADTSASFSFSMTSDQDAAYISGIPIAGSNRAAWISRFPNRSTSPYRKLVDAGY